MTQQEPPETTTSAERPSYAENAKPTRRSRAADATNHEPKRLTAKELQFVEEYVANGRNGTQAYKQVYPNAAYTTCRNEAAVLLAKPCIAAELKAANRAFTKQHRAQFGRTLAELAKLAHSDLGQVLEHTPAGPRLRPWNRIPAAARQAIASLEITPVFPPASKSTGRGKKSKPAKHLMKIKVRMHDKGRALDKIAHHLGLYDAMPALERILSGLPAELADQIREELRRQVEAAQQSVPGPRLGLAVDADPDADGDLHGDGTDPGPVASKIPAGLVEPPNGLGLSSSGEIDGGSGENLAPLFDDP